MIMSTHDDIWLNHDEPFPGSSSTKPWKAGAGIGPGGWNSRELAHAQESAATLQTAHPQRTYRLYTETKPNLLELVSRYFPGATLIPAIGLWTGKTEDSAVIEIVATASTSDLQKVVNLAGDIRHMNAQSAVLVTWHDVNSLMVESAEVAYHA